MSEIKTNQISSLTGSNSDITLDPDGTGNLIVESGNVGIGTTSPAQALEISGTAPTIRLTDTGASNNYSEINADYTSGSIHISADTANASANSRIMFQVDNTERMRIDSSGNVGIGQSSPATPLHINGIPGTSTLRLDAGGTLGGSRRNWAISGEKYAAGTLSFEYGSTEGAAPSNESVRFTDSGINSSAVAGNTTVSSANLFISGGNNFQKSTSSRRYKTEITDATHGLADVLNLRSVTYKGVNDGETVFGGLIAEEVHDAGLTEFVNYSEDENGNNVPEGIHYGHMVSLAFKAIQELKTELDAEKAKVADLVARVTALENA